MLTGSGDQGYSTKVSREEMKGLDRHLLKKEVVQRGRVSANAMVNGGGGNQERKSRSSDTTEKKIDGGVLFRNSIHAWPCLERA